MAFAKEESLVKLIQNFSANTRKTSKQKQTKRFLSARRKLLGDYWQRYSVANEEVVCMEVSEQNKAEVAHLVETNRQVEVEAAYCEALGDLNDCIDELSATIHEAKHHSTPNLNVSQHANSSLKILPKIDLPKFDGNFNTWLTFKDMFFSYHTVHYQTSKNCNI